MNVGGLEEVAKVDTDSEDLELHGPLYLDIAEVDIDSERLEAHGPLRDRYHHRFAIMAGQDGRHYKAHVVQVPKGRDEDGALGIMAIDNQLDPRKMAAAGNIHYMNGSSRMLVVDYDPDCYLLRPENPVKSRGREFAEGIGELLVPLLEKQGIEVDGVHAFGVQPQNGAQY